MSHDTRIFRFGLPTAETKLGLPTGMHMFIRAEIDGNLVMRSYIPIADKEITGHVDLLVKVYGRGVHPSFPDDGKMSQHLDSLSDGYSIEVRGPVRELVYKGHGPYYYKGVGGNCIHMFAHRR